MDESDKNMKRNLPDRPDRYALWEVFGVYTAAIALCIVLLVASRALPTIASNFHALIAAVFLVLPTWVIAQRGDDGVDYGLSVHPIGRGLWLFLALSLVVFPLFAIGFYGFYRGVCVSGIFQIFGTYARSPRVLRRLCIVFSGTPRPVLFSWELLNLALVNIVVVALPEEVFFRGYIQTRLEQCWPPRRTFLGGSMGRAVRVTSLLFAAAHLVADPAWTRLAVFFPSLLFGWIRGAGRSLLPAILFHAASNVFSTLLYRTLG